MPTIKKRTHRPWQPKREAFGGYRHHNTEFYQSAPWRRLRAVKLEQNPMCEECERNGRYTPAQMVDHIVPINKGGSVLDLDNLQSLCGGCHNEKHERFKKRRPRYMRV